MVNAFDDEWALWTALDVHDDGSVRLMATVDVPGSYDDYVVLHARRADQSWTGIDVTDRIDVEVQTLTVARTPDDRTLLAVGRDQNNVDGKCHIELLEWTDGVGQLTLIKDFPGAAQGYWQYSGTRNFVANGDGLFLAYADPDYQTVHVVRRAPGSNEWTEELTYPLTGAEDNFDSLQLLEGADGELWLSLGHGRISVFHRSAGMWSGPEVALDTYIFDSVLAASRSGAVFLAYSIPGDGTATHEVFGRLRIGGEWQPAEHIGTTFSGGQIEAAVDLDGRPWSTFVQDSEGPVEMQVLAHRDETGWSTEDLFPGAPGYLSGASLLFDRHGSMWLAARNDHAVELRTRCATPP